MVPKSPKMEPTGGNPAMTTARKVGEERRLGSRSCRVSNLPSSHPGTLPFPFWVPGNLPPIPAKERKGGWDGEV